MLPKFKNIFALTLLLGLIFAELWPSLQNFSPQAAQANTTLTAEQQALVLSILENNGSEGSTLPSSPPNNFIYFDTINSPQGAVKNDINLFKVITGITAPKPTVTPSFGESVAAGLTPDIISSITAPAGTSLQDAYSEGGRVFYEKAPNVLVIFPDETTRSYNKTTGSQNTWLARAMALPPIRNTEAYYKLQTDFHGIIVAEASDWVLMEFPSGAVLKVGKPEYNSALPSGGTFTPELPTVLPGYGN